MIYPSKIVHCKREAYDVYIGRPSKWGNPYVIGKDGTRDEVIDKYAWHLLTHPALLRDVEELRGKTLGCWCKPNRCHGEVLLSILEGGPLYDGMPFRRLQDLSKTPFELYLDRPDVCITCKFGKFHGIRLQCGNKRSPNYKKFSKDFKRTRCEHWRYMA